MTERRPVEPRARAAFEQAEAALARTKQDQSQADVAGKAAVELKQTQAERDAQLRAASEAVKAERDAAVKARQKKARDEYMALPLTDDEKVELEGLERALSEPGNVPPALTRRVRDLQTKAQIKTKKDK
jgi:hypothetical protein